MDATDLLVTLLLGSVVALCAGVACWYIDRVAKKKQSDWHAESGMRGQR